jgi:hypothetical protein
VDVFIGAIGDHDLARQRLACRRKTISASRSSGGARTVAEIVVDEILAGIHR